MRRGPGILALDRSSQSSAQYTSLSNELNESKVEDLRKQIDSFAKQLRAFAVAHRKDIRHNPEFRHAFQKMCSSMWVDPLAGRPATASAGSRLGKAGELWNDLLGFGDWQHELGVQVVDVCVSTRARNGGIISMRDLIDGILRLRCSSSSFTTDVEGLAEHITEDDVKRSIHALRPLGCGYQVFSVQGTTMVRTVPHELSEDAMSILAHLSSSEAQRDTLFIPFFTLQDAHHSSYPNFQGWSESRAQRAIEDMILQDGTLWVDIVPSDRSSGPERDRERYYALTLC